MDFLAKLLGAPASKKNSGASHSVEVGPAPTPPHPGLAPPPGSSVLSPLPPLPASPAVTLAPQGTASSKRTSSSDEPDRSLSDGQSEQSFDTASWGVTASGAFADPLSPGKTRGDTDSDTADFESADEQSLTATEKPDQGVSTPGAANQRSFLAPETPLTKLADRLENVHIKTPKPTTGAGENPFYAAISGGLEESLDVSFSSTQAHFGSEPPSGVNFSVGEEQPSFSALNALAAACEELGQESGKENVPHASDRSPGLSESQILDESFVDPDVRRSIRALSIASEESEGSSPLFSESPLAVKPQVGRAPVLKPATLVLPGEPTQPQSDILDISSTSGGTITLDETVCVSSTKSVASDLFNLSLTSEDSPKPAVKKEQLEDLETTPERSLIEEVTEETSKLVIEVVTTDSVVPAPEQSSTLSAEPAALEKQQESEEENTSEKLEDPTPVPTEKAAEAVAENHENAPEKSADQEAEVGQKSTEDSAKAEKAPEKSAGVESAIVTSDQQSPDRGETASTEAGSKSAEQSIQNLQAPETPEVTEGSISKRLLTGFVGTERGSNTPPQFGESGSIALLFGSENTASAEELSDKTGETPDSIPKEVKSAAQRESGASSQFGNSGSLSQLFDLCERQQHNLESDSDDLGELLAAEAARVCEEISNASLELEQEPPAMEDSVERPSRAKSPRHPSPHSSGDEPTSRPLHARFSTSPRRKEEEDLSGAEVNQSEAGPEIAPREEQFVSSEIFKDPNAFDFLSSKGGGSNVSRRLERESLYVKFDPLVSARDRRVFLSPCLETSRGEEASPLPSVAGASVDAHKSPAASVVGTLINIATPSPARAAQLLDTPLRGGTKQEKGEAPITMQNVVDLQDLLDRQKSAFEERMAREQEETAEKLAALQKQLEDAQNAITIQAAQLAGKTTSEKKMTLVMKEYENTMSSMVSSHEQQKKEWEAERESLEAERKQALEDLAKVEVSFSDLHSKYERAKTAIMNLKSNEDQLRASNAQCMEQIRKGEDKYNKLKAHAEGQLEKANMEIDALVRKNNLEKAAAEAQVKRLQAKTTNLEESLEARQRENQELMNICDELVAKVGNKVG